MSAREETNTSIHKGVNVSIKKKFFLISLNTNFLTLHCTSVKSQLFSQTLKTPHV